MPATRLHFAASTALAFAALVSPAIAQQQPQRGATPTISLDEVVITATRSETRLREAPVAISVVGEREVQRRTTASVAELLRDVPGVQLDESSLPGLKRIRIRGEEARRSMVLIDGQEITDHTTYGPPLLIDPALIERIEVVRGPLSVLYGSRAIGGVVNIITRRPSTQPVELTVGAGYDSATHGYKAHGLASGAINGFYYRLFAGRSEDTTRLTPNGKLPNTYYETTSFSAQLGYRNEKHDVRIGYDLYKLSSQSSTPPGTTGPGSIFTRFQLAMPQRDRGTVSFFYEGRDLLPLMSRLTLNAYHQTIDRRFQQEVAGFQPFPPPPRNFDFLHRDGDQLTTIGANLQAEWKLPGENTLITGVQWLYDRQDKNATRDGFTQILTHPPTRPAPRVPVALNADLSASTRSLSFYAQNTWRFAPGWQLIAGARHLSIESGLDRTNNPTLYPLASRSASRLIGSAALIWSPTETLTLRAGWGQGYIAPTLLQKHTGTFFGSGFTVRANPGLRPETSDSFEAGARYDDGVWRLDGTVFHTRARDYILSESNCAVAGVVCLPGEISYRNVDRANTTGLELAAGWRFGNGFELYGSGAAIQRELQYPDFKTTKAGVPAFSGRLGLRYEAPWGTNVNWWVDGYVRAASAITLETSRRTFERAKGWATLNLEFGATWRAPDRFGEHSLSMALINLTDARYRPALEELTQPGRAIAVNWRSTF
jgi:hemoglobin/transferrin/lactoferrin receptor protein